MLPEYASASFFDLDHTLCNANTSFRFGIYLFRQKKLPLYAIPYLISIYFLCKAGLFPLSFLHKQACFLVFYKKSLNTLEADVSQFLDGELKTILNPSILALFETAKKNHHYTALLSNSPDFLVEAIAKRLHFDAWAGTEYRKDSKGKITGMAHSLEGKDKASLVKQMIKRLSINPEQTYAYSDSHLDLPFLEAVRHPTAVNPDKTLSRIAINKGWTILDDAP